MEIKQIDWKKIKPRIGRWVRTEAHAGQVKYDLESDLSDPYTITQFTVDFEDETVSTGWREELGGYQEEVPLTPEENAEARQMISDCRLIDLVFHVTSKEDAKRSIEPLKSTYNVDMKLEGDIAYIHGNHMDIAYAISDGLIRPWSVEDPEVEHDKACGLPESVWGNWDY